MFDSCLILAEIARKLRC